MACIMRHGFKSIAAREKVVGWYHTGPKLRANDSDINELMRRFVPNPVRAALLYVRCLIHRAASRDH